MDMELVGRNGLVVQLFAARASVGEGYLTVVYLYPTYSRAYPTFTRHAI